MNIDGLGATGNLNSIVCLAQNAGDRSVLFSLPAGLYHFSIRGDDGAAWRSERKSADSASR
jgi:hypothetical protein